MDSNLGFTFILLSLFLRINLNFSSIDIKDLLPLKCRIAGVVLVEKKFNYTMAETACELLGLQLASRANVQKAWSFGFETCSYGWVMEKFGVISRIQNNEKCGRNLTGVLTWTVPLSRDFSAYCFNASDLRINSCKPQLMVTIPPSTVKPTTGSPVLPTTRQQIPEPQERSTAWPILPTTLREPTSRPLLTTLITIVRLPPKEVPPATTPKEVPPATTPKEVPPAITPKDVPPAITPKEVPLATTPRMTTQPPTEEPTNPPENQAARQSEKIVFGKLPTALLILALVFFVAAVVLAICYIKKYKTNVFFRKIKEEKESVETKVFKETVTAENMKEEEVTSNGREERLLTPEANTGSSVEAEV